MKLVYWIIVLVLGFAILFISSCFLLPSEPEVEYAKIEEITSIDDIVAPYLALEESHALSIALIKSGVVSYYNYGKISNEDPSPPTKKSIYEIGSISKVFTGTLLADMVTKRELDLEDNVMSFLPDTLARWESMPISLKELSTHMSRIPRLPNNLNKTITDQNNPYKNYDAKALYEYLSKYKPKAKDQRKSVYSNLGAGLLGHALALKGTKSYEAMIKERILDSLDMSNTGISFAEKQMVQGHDMGGEATSFWDFDALAGCGAIRSTTEDLSKFLLANIHGGKAFDLAQMAHVEDGSQGLGWAIRPLKDSKGLMHWHNGGTGGFRTFAGIIKDKELGVVVLSNTSISVDMIGVLALKLALKE